MNGWTNYPTWNLMLWIDNEESTQRFWNEKAKNCLEASKYSTFEAKYLLADELKNWYMDGIDWVISENNRHSTYGDILIWALEQINYIEIAEAILEGL